MALYRFEAKIISRSGGRSTLNAAAYRTGKTATSAAAYRHGAELKDERTGQVYDYSRKRGVEGSQIIATADAPEWAHDRAKLWNEVERIERRKDSQLARDFVISLPHELDATQRRALLTEFLQTNFVDKGYLCDVAYHAPHGKGDDRNHHAHVMVPMRRLDAVGFAKKKDRPEGNPHDAWQTELAQLRKDWADTTNRHLAAAGRSERVSHLSLVEQGVDREPEPKQGPIATEMEREGRESHAGSDRRRVQAENADRAKLKSDTANVVILAVEIIRRGTVAEVMDEQHNEQLRLQTDAAAQLAERDRQHQVTMEADKKRMQAAAEDAQKKADANAAKVEKARLEGDISDPNARWQIALGNNYDMGNPYESMAKAAMSEHAAFTKRQEELRKEAAAEKDPAKRADLELVRRIEGHDYMAITGHRIADMSDVIAGRQDSPRGIVAHARADMHQEEANKLRAERAGQLAERERQERQSIADGLGKLAQDIERGKPLDAKAVKVAAIRADIAASANRRGQTATAAQPQTTGRDGWKGAPRPNRNEKVTPQQHHPPSADEAKDARERQAAQKPDGSSAPRGTGERHNASHEMTDAKAAKIAAIKADIAASNNSAATRSAGAGRGRG